MSDETETNSEPLDKDPHPDHAPLTWGDVRKAQAKARREIALKKIEDAEYERAEAEERLANPPPPPSNRLTENLSESDKELVTIVLNLPPTMKELRIDNVIFQNGVETKPIPMAVARDLIYMQNKGWEVEEVITHGKDRYAFYQQMKRQQQGPVHVSRIPEPVRVSPPGA